MNLKELREKRDALLASAKTALEGVTKAIAASEFEKVDEQQKQVDDLMKQVESVNKAIATAEVQEAATKATKNVPEAARLPFETGDPVEPETPVTKAINPIHVMRFGTLDAAVKQVTEDLYGPDYLEQRNVQMGSFNKYLRLGDKGLDATGQKALHRLIVTPDVITKEVQVGYSVEDIQKAVATQQEATLELGGVLVPEDFRLSIIKRMMGLTIMRGRARQVNTIRDAVEWPKIDSADSQYTSQARVTWVDEVPSSATVAQTSIEFASLRIPVHTVMARLDMSLNLLEDAGMDIVGMVSQFFAESMAIDEDIKFLTGVGSGTPQGILGNRSGAEFTPITGVTSVVSGDASLLTADGLIDLSFGLDSQYLANAIFMGTKNTFRDIRQLKDGNGDYLWERGIAKGTPPQLLGYDYYMTQSLQEIGAGKYPLIFGDPQGYLIVDRVGMTVKRVEDTTTTGQNKAALFARRRLGGQVITPWSFAAQQVAAS